MGVTGVAPLSREPLRTQIGKLVSSDVLRSSESLCRLLRYLADQSVDHPGASIKEYQIAVDVFGRSTDFDPRLDSTVRVQTSRLRSKLAEYYAGAGADDLMIIEIPKGSYSLVVHPRAAVAPPKPAPLTEAPEAAPVAPPERANSVVWALSFVVAGLALALLYVTVLQKRAAAPARAEVPAQLGAFWKSFIDGPEQPWVVFSNAEFVGRPETGMRYFDPKKDDRGRILDHYTGVGEVIAVHELDRLFTSLHHAILVKRGRLLSMDDAKNHDLIFIGSPSENLTLRDIPNTKEFVFRVADSGPRKGDLAIFNLKPRPGEQPVWHASAKMPIDEDYALVALIPGITSSQWVMILAGTTTIGTQAAVEFTCRSATVDALLKRIGRAANGEVLPFEAVLRVKISRGVPVASELVAVHTHGS